MATTSVVKPQGPAELPGHETALALAPVSSLPSIAEIRQKMAWMTEFRAVLLDFVQHHMDPARHMYSFESNRYTPLNAAELRTMAEEGKKPALNQDGIHNLMSLYECYIDEPQIVEVRAEGYYTCRATVKLISFRSGLPMGAGTGSCSTRESKYAYRWVYQSEVPKGTDKTALKQRDFEGKNGKSYTKYRMENEDLADVEATVLQMAMKRAKSAAVKCLPLVSEMFAGVGDPDEDKHEEDIERQEVLKPISAWLRGMKTTVRVKAVLAVFGEPLGTFDAIQKLDIDRLAVAAQVIAIATKGGVAWDSPTVVADVTAALRASAAQAKADLFGDNDSGDPHQRAATPQVREGSTAAPPPPAAPSSPRREGMAWDTLRQYRDDARLPDGILESIDAALHGLIPLPESEALTLAGAVHDWISKAQEGREAE